jgi:hypothetical protein
LFSSVIADLYLLRHIQQKVLGRVVAPARLGWPVQWYSATHIGYWIQMVDSAAPDCRGVTLGIILCWQLSWRSAQQQQSQA